jgi:hypothetical protein
MSANHKMAASLEYWHKLEVLSCGSAQDFAEHFCASPDYDDCGDATHAEIVAAAEAYYRGFATGGEA